MEIDVKVSYTKRISRCYNECPYFYLDGGPGPVMACDHPEVKARYEKTKDLGEIYIISHPECDNGFPKKCPLLKDIL